MKVLTVMLDRKVINLVMCFFLVLINLSMVKGQEKKTIVLPELSINNDKLTIILDSLIAEERKCSHFEKSLLWVISISEKSDSKYLIEIQIIRNFNRLADISKVYGFFYYNQILFIARNKHVESLFTISKREKEFSFNEWEMPRPERYSMWHYHYENGEFILKGDYRIDCN